MRAVANCLLALQLLVPVVQLQLRRVGECPALPCWRLTGRAVRGLSPALSLTSILLPCTLLQTFSVPGWGRDRGDTCNLRARLALAGVWWIIPVMGNHLCLAWTLLRHLSRGKVLGNFTSQVAAWSCWGRMEEKGQGRMEGIAGQHRCHMAEKALSDAKSCKLPPCWLEVVAWQGQSQHRCQGLNSAWGKDVGLAATDTLPTISATSNVLLAPLLTSSPGPTTTWGSCKVAASVSPCKAPRQKERGT